MNNDNFKIIEGDIFHLEKNVECIVNAWNTNIIPLFLLFPHGISGKLKKIAGYKPFNELLKFGIMKPGDAVLTSGGRLSGTKIIHVAGINYIWQSNLNIVERCIRNALTLAKKHNLKSIAFPVIGSGIGGLKEDDVINVMSDVVNEKDWSIKIIIVKYKKTP